jgi:hypothetical protein
MTDTATAPQRDAETVAWIQRADATLAAWQTNPNDLLRELLKAECVVTFKLECEGELFQVDMFGPDSTWSTGTGPAPVNALLAAYASSGAKSAHAALQAAAIVATAPDELTAATMPPALSLVK